MRFPKPTVFNTPHRNRQRIRKTAFSSTHCKFERDEEFYADLTCCFTSLHKEALIHWSVRLSKQSHKLMKSALPLICSDEISVCFAFRVSCYSTYSTVIEPFSSANMQSSSWMRLFLSKYTIFGVSDSDSVSDSGSGFLCQDVTCARPRRSGRFIKSS